MVAKEFQRLRNAFFFEGNFRLAYCNDRPLQITGAQKTFTVKLFSWESKGTSTELIIKAL